MGGRVLEEHEWGGEYWRNMSEGGRVLEEHEWGGGEY